MSLHLLRSFHIVYKHTSKCTHRRIQLEKTSGQQQQQRQKQQVITHIPKLHDSQIAQFINSISGCIVSNQMTSKKSTFKQNNRTTRTTRTECTVATASLAPLAIAAIDHAAEQPVVGSW
jgi:hypothetical protein